SYAQVHKGMTAAQLKSTANTIMKRMGRNPRMFEPYLAETISPVKLTRVACSEGRVNLYFSEAINRIAIREELTLAWEQTVRDSLGADYADAKVGLFCESIPIERFIPNLYRSKYAADSKRKKSAPKTAPLVEALDKQYISQGLNGRHIALWPSHGIYYDQSEDLWQFQRPALYGTIEDLHTFLYSDKYLIPMLENAGAVVITPRERDTSKMEIIIDRDASSHPQCQVEYSTGWTTQKGGFALSQTLGDLENPFTMGNYSLSPKTGGKVTYKAPIEESGTHAIYVSYKPLSTNSTQARYTIESKNQRKEYLVNQQIAGGWVYLGKIDCDSIISITLEADSQITTDAIKIGGGMGNVVRAGKLSQMARWYEAARYFMQYSGVDPKIYHQKHNNGKISDYMDDYKSRGDWVTYIMQEQRIPIDAAVAMHSNAGIVDSIYGTLTIHYTNKGRDTYTDQKSKYSGRDYADIIHTQIVEDIRALYDPLWIRRSMYDKSYAEVSRPDAPALIVEMFSHQNMNDMRYGLAPEFRFTLSRAVYKGIVKYLADRYSIPYQITPLAPSDFGVKIENQNLTFSWKPTTDPLEPTATTESYIINGEKTTSTSYEIKNSADGKVHQINVAAANQGGESFPSETIEYALYPQNTQLELVITDIEHRRTIDTLSVDSTYRGLDLDPKKFTYDDYCIVGEQIDFDPKSEFIDNTYPGWGASKRDLLGEGVISPATKLAKEITAKLQAQKKSYVMLPLESLNNMPKNCTKIYIITNKEQKLLANILKAANPEIEVEELTF
ncbi:MAG: hypothetical protein R3Y19_04045, partial [Rikenellaceae bacterium]